MIKKIVVTGATGLIGRILCKELIIKDYEVTIFTRDINSAKNTLGEIFAYVKWDYKNPSEWQNHLHDKDAIVHLAGANLFGKRWSSEYKKEIFESRVISTKNLVSALRNNPNKVKVFISSSGVGYYGSRGEEILTESSNPGSDFIADLVTEWESEAEESTLLGVRTVKLRQGIVLSNEGGALSKFLPPFRFFVGGSLGSGEQWFPWIHIKDLISIYLFVLEEQKISDSVNAVSPMQVRMNEFAKMLGKVLNRPSIFKVPEFALKILVGDAASTILSSQRVIPKMLLDHGFKFQFDNLEAALVNLIKNNRK